VQRHLRLRDKDDFERLKTSGQTRRYPFLILNVVPNRLPHNRYAFVTSKRLGKAVIRNRTRRVLREIVRQVDPVLAPGYDVLFIARGPIVGQPYAAVNEAVLTSLRHAGLWVGEPS
jgi:ribonuclease P protein component